MNTHIPNPEPCVSCGKMTTLRFLCPCDLFHPMCERCLNKEDVRKDCAYLINVKQEMA